METMNHILMTSPKEGRGDLKVPDSLRRDLHIRLADSADWTRMAHIYNEAIHSGQSTMDLIPVDASYFRKLADGFTPRECLLIAQLAGHVAGWGIVKQYSDRPGYALACETSVYVAEDHQSQGIGGALQSAVIQRAWCFGYRHLVAKILAVNEHSICFHHHFNYEISGIQKNIGFLNGMWHDIIIMQCLLTDEPPMENLS
jgi:L-amino acid N-acyltransferase YncA